MDFDKYVCTLDAPSIEKAKKELHENPDDRVEACKALKEWIEAQPHLKCPYTNDIAFLLRMMRGAKWSQLRAREMLDGMSSMKTAIPEWFENLDIYDSKIKALVDEQYVMPLPKRDKDGCKLLLIRLGQLDPNFKKYSRLDTMRMRMITSLFMARDEMTQVNGIVFIMDFTGVTMKLLSQFMDRGDMSKFQKLIQKNMPGRFKAFHHYNGGVLFETFFQFARPFLPKKYQDRIQVHNTAESLFRVVDMSLLPIEYLPDDYKGPSAGHVKEINDNFKNEFFRDDFRDFLLHWSSDAFGVDESKRPKVADQTTETFRKLTVD